MKKGFVINKIKSRAKRGFTLAELLVVVSIIGLLMALVLANFGDARDFAKLSRAKNDMSAIAKGMKVYEIDIGELPPRDGGINTSDNFPNDQEEWREVVDALMNSDGDDWQGPYLNDLILEDPWGNHYIYEDHACNAPCGDSYLSTAGPDREKGTDDDYTIIVTEESEVESCCN